MAEEKVTKDKKKSSFPTALKVILAAAVLLLMVILVVIISTTDTFVLRGSGVLTTENLDVSDFDRISLSGQGTIVVDQTGKEGLKVTAEDNLIDRITTVVEGNTLKIELKKERFFWSFWPTKKIEYHVSVDDLEQITISGSGFIETDKLEADDFKIRISGSGKGEMDIEVDSLELDISGSGNFIMSGKAEKQRITISGSGNYEGKELKSDDTDITINGSGKGTVNASDSLDVSINGSGNIKYLGSPSINQQISGSGKISRFED